MSEIPIIQLSEKCPNCGFENPLDALVCSGCGININAYEMNIGKLEEIKLHTLHKTNQKDDYYNQNNQGFKDNRDQNLYKKRITSAIFITVIIGLIIVVVVLATGFWLKHRHETAKEYFSSAQNCLNKKNYDCAEEAALNARKNGYNKELVSDLLINVSLVAAKEALSLDMPATALEYLDTCLTSQPNNLECIQIACISKIKMVNRFAGSAQWEKAVLLMDEIIIACPDLSEQRANQEQLFINWYADALRNGNLIEINKVKQLWYARFPKN